MNLFVWSSGNTNSVWNGVRGLLVLLGFLIRVLYSIPLERRAVALPSAASFFWVKSRPAWLLVLWFFFFSVDPEFPSPASFFPFATKLSGTTSEAMPSQIATFKYFLVSSCQFLSSCFSDLPSLQTYPHYFPTWRYMSSSWGTTLIYVWCC